MLANAGEYSGRLRLHTSRMQSSLDAVTRECVPLLLAKQTTASKLDNGKFISLLIAIFCLVLLVIEPLLRSNKNNLNRLQLAKVELQQEKKYLSSILNSQTNYVIRLNKEGNFTFANPEFLKTFDYVFEDLVHTAFYNTIFPKDILRCREIAEQCWQNPGKIFRILIRKPLNKSKNYLWTEWEFIALFNEDNSITEIQGIGLDVSDKIQAQQSKEEAIQTLSYAMGYASMGAWKYNLETREFTMSAEMKSLMGLTDKDPDIISMEDFVTDFVLPQDIFLVAAETEKIIRSKKDKAYESAFSYRITTKQGNIRHLFIKGKPLNDQFRFGIAQDITTHKEALAEVKQSEALLRSVIDATPDLIFIKDTEHRHLMVNKAYADLLNLTPEDIIGKNDIELGFSEERAKGDSTKGIRGFWQDDDEVMSTGRIKNIPEESAYANGELHYFSIVKAPLRDDEDKVWGVLGFAHNITGIKQVEDNLRKKDQLLQAVSEATHQLIGNKNLEEAIGEGVFLLGIKMQVDIISVYKNLRSHDNKLMIQQVACWNASGEQSEVLNISAASPFSTDSFSTEYIAAKTRFTHLL